MDVCGEVLDRLKQVGEDKSNDNKVKQCKSSPRESIKIGIGLPDNFERKCHVNKVWTKHLVENRKKWQDLCHAGGYTSSCYNLPRAFENKSIVLKSCCSWH
jgi:hypothetical protein